MRPRALLAPLLTGLFLGCSSVGDVTDRPTGVSTALTIAGPAGTTTMTVGTSATLAVHVERTAAFDGDVIITVRDPAASVTVGPLTIPAGATDGVLEITIDAAAPQGNVDLTVVGANANGVTTAETKVTLFLRGEPGSLDTTYANGSLLGFRPGHAVIDPNGMTVIVGTKQAGDNTSDFAIARLDASGRLDDTFGTGGVATLDFSAGDTAIGVAMTADSKILVCGAIGSGAISNDRAVLLRFDETGTLDTSFATGGRATLPLMSGRFGSVAVQQDGGILAGGTAAPEGTLSNVGMIAHFTAGGLLDPAFGTNGIVTSTLGTANGSYDYIAKMLPDASGVAVAGVYSTTSGQVTANTAYIGRYSLLGRVDTMFGAGGKTDLDALLIGPRFDSIDDMVHTSDGKILAMSGHSTLGQSQIPLSVVLSRASVTGIPDPGFGTNGMVTIGLGPTGYLSGSSLAPQADGKLLFVASTSATVGGGPIYLARRMPDGGPDASFGKNGVAPTSGLDNIGYSGDILLQRDGRIVVVYSSPDYQNGATARFWN